MSKKIARRTFLKASAASATAAGYFLTASVTESAERRADDPMRRLNVACIGCGGQGHSNVGGVSRENIVALCDVDSERASRRFNEFPKAPKYTDFRVMLEKQKDIEAVTVSTADHTHAVAAMMAIQMGKHVYCEKPLTHSVWEARQLRLAAVKHRVATQMGNQGTSSDGLRTGVEIVRSGAIGDVREVHVWTDRPGRYWRQGIASGPRGSLSRRRWPGMSGSGPPRSVPTTAAYHPFAQGGWWDFGTGALGDMACHIMNLPYMALVSALRLGRRRDRPGEIDQQREPA
ncbi:MAG: Gfo/Idh/MocA family oxidoreductase [Gemmataceae bacterium]